VTALYQAHALGLIRLAVVMLGDRPAAEDVVQEAFCGLYRRWHALSDTDRAPRSLACQEDSIITPDGSLIVCGAVEMLKTTEKTSHGQFSLLSDVETGFVEYSAATGQVAHILGHWTFNNETSDSVEVLWSNASGGVLIGVIPSANGNGRVGVISGNEFTPMPAQAAPVSPDTGTW
jgi:hypothetical protein